MNIKPFAVEEWMNTWEENAVYNIAETCVDSISLEEFAQLIGEAPTSLADELMKLRLTYGHIVGRPAYKEGIASLYRHIEPNHIVPTHGAAGANYHVFLSLIKPGDHVVSVAPTYQQLYEIPASLGASVSVVRLRKENSYLPDLKELEQAITPKTTMICLNNPNNPTGALMDEAMLRDIVAIAQRHGLWILCDEVYRHLSQRDTWEPSVADLYEKGISVSSMSKVFSLAGLRLGWIATRDESVLTQCWRQRDYNLISCGLLDEYIAGKALAHKDVLLQRSRAIVRTNLEILDTWISKEPRLHYVKPLAGTTVLVHYEASTPSYELCEDMYKKTGAFVTPGDCFDEPYSFRVGYAYGTETLKKGLAAVSDYFATL